MFVSFAHCHSCCGGLYYDNLAAIVLTVNPAAVPIGASVYCDVDSLFYSDSAAVHCVF